MTTEPDKSGNPARSKFDDVASLFGTIVPSPGSPIKPPRVFRPLPVALPDASTPSIIPLPSKPEVVPNREAASADDRPIPMSMPDALPESMADNVPPVPVASLVPPPALSLRPVPPREVPRAAARPRPTEIPWPDAFEPRPNFKKAEPRNYSWLLTIPVGLVAAVAFTMVDIRAVRSWVDVNLLQRSPTASLESPLVPAPFRAGTNTNTNTNTGAEQPNPAQPVPEPENPYPAIPTSPVPVPPGTEAALPTVEPTEAEAPLPPIHVTIQYRRNVPGADGEARRLAALLQNTGGSVETRPNVTTVKAPTITYYNAADRTAAAALAVVLGNEAPNWIVRLGTAKNPPGNIDVSMP